MARTGLQTARSTTDADRATVTPPWQVVAERNLPTIAELTWLADRQTGALARIAASGLPDSASEAWRYTNLNAYAKRWSGFLAAEQDTNSVAGSPSPSLAASQTVSPQPGPDDINLDLIDGRLSRLPGEVRQGLTIQSFRSLSELSRERVDTLLQLQAGGTSNDALVDLNTALLHDGLLIATSPGQQQLPTIHLRSHLSATSLIQSRVLVDVAPGSHLSLIVEHSGAPGCLSNTVLQIRLGQDSRLGLVRVQALPGDGMATESTLIELADAAELAVTSVDMGAQLSRQTLTILLAGTGASADVQGMFLADGNRHIDNQTSMVHKAPGTTSRETFRGIADDHGRGIFGGRILVLPGAAGSNAALTNRNLLLAPTAEINTKPELEIYVDDVRCSHGATTGQLDANALFYLQSRGLDAADARKVLTVAFLREGLSGIPDLALRARLDAQLKARMGKSSTANLRMGAPA
ncbi:MAG: Fe-S cluster assembly protein SufD [Gammaproteobacteria bacterium]